jgi:hypothetical protein
MVQHFADWKMFNIAHLRQFSEVIGFHWPVKGFVNSEQK